MSSKPTITTGSYNSSRVLKTCETLFMDESSADVKFIFVSSDGVQQYLPAHKLLLITASPVFAAMFSGKYKEADEVAIVGASFDEFKEFSQVFYLNKITLTLEHVPAVMNLANMYDVAELLNLCEEFLLQHLPVDSVCVALGLAITFNRQLLREHCLCMISKNSTAVFATESFKQCSNEVLKQILERGDLNCSAKEVFNACMEWAPKVANRKKQLGICFYLIPFHLMSRIELNECTTEHQALFTKDELMEIMSIMALGASCLKDLKKFKMKADFKAKSLKHPMVNESRATTMKKSLPAKRAKKAVESTSGVYLSESGSDRSYSSSYRSSVTSVPSSSRSVQMTEFRAMSSSDESSSDESFSDSDSE